MGFLHLCVGVEGFELRFERDFASAVGLNSPWCLAATAYIGVMQATASPSLMVTGSRRRTRLPVLVRDRSEQPQELLRIDGVEAVSATDIGSWTGHSVNAAY